MKHCRTFEHLSVMRSSKAEKTATRHQNFKGLVGMVPAYPGGNMLVNPGLSIRKILIGAGLVALLAQFAPAPAIAVGGSDGGTNTNRDTKEPVEFQAVGNRVRIDPRTFEGLYAELLPKIRAIEAKIPGLGKELKAVLDQRSWFITDREFAPRNSNEEKPINQDSEHVFLTAQKIKEMSHEQLKRAWMHEMVRRMIQDGHPETTPERGFNKANCTSFPDFSNTSEQSLRQSDCRFFKPLTQPEIDQLVEKLTVVLYQEYDMPARMLSKYINDILGNTLFAGEGGFSNSRLGYLSRPEIDERINRFQLKEKYLRACKSNNLTITGGDLTSIKNYLSAANSPFVSPDCLLTSRLADAKTQASAHTFVKECVKPQARGQILASLNALQNDVVENDWHDPTEPFRTHDKGVTWSDGYDTYAHPPMNQYGSLGYFMGIGFFESGISGAIYGKIKASSNVEAQTFDDDERVVLATQSCIFMTVHPDAVPAIINASSDSNSASIGTDVVTDLDQALSALRSSGTRNPASDARVTSNSSKQVGETPADPVQGAGPQVATAGSAQ